jgi:hypothetical protein
MVNQAQHSLQIRNQLPPSGVVDDHYDRHNAHVIPTASKKALTANLRSLETLQLILRRDPSNSVLQVKYEIAEAARTPLAALVSQLAGFPKYLPSPANDSRCRTFPLLTALRVVNLSWISELGVK